MPDSKKSKINAPAVKEGGRMFKAKRYIVMMVTNALLVFVLIILAMELIPDPIAFEKHSQVFVWSVAAVLFFVLSIVLHKLSFMLVDKLRQKTLFTGESGLLSEFMEKLRFCYSLDDFYELIGKVLEVKGDCAVLFVDCEKNYVLYNSPNKVTCDPEVLRTLELNFDKSWPEGVFFLGSNYGIVSGSKNARGFFMSFNNHHLYVFCRYTRLFDESLYGHAYKEIVRFFKRAKTIDNLAEIAELSSEWNQLADTQRSFLPPVMPDIERLKVAAYYRPLVNVSGDYYTVLPINRQKTLLMLGDVSGKGLAAGLVMGLVMNTVKILDNKEDLANMIQAVDKAIKGMKLQDKYTVLFLGVVDTAKMTIRYINASMSDPLIISRSVDGYRIKPLTSNCSVVGIIDLPEQVEVAEQRLFRGDVILMASDGVSEVMDESGEELGNTKLYEDTIKSSAVKSPDEFIDDVIDLVMTYNGDKKLRDDVTMMVAKIEG
jgi:serine phosphatase RsbU (regulator of sigma subunit)